MGLGRQRPDTEPHVAKNGCILCSFAEPLQDLALAHTKLTRPGRSLDGDPDRSLAVAIWPRLSSERLANDPRPISKESLSTGREKDLVILNGGRDDAIDPSHSFSVAPRGALTDHFLNPHLDLFDLFREVGKELMALDSGRGKGTLDDSLKAV